MYLMILTDSSSLLRTSKRECTMINLHDKLYSYVSKFNRADEECYVQDIANDTAFAWLRENIPLLDCPDKILEEIYYFRWWVFRKHIKHTEDGFVITEFLPPVPWSGRHNTIIAAAAHHIAEARWMKCGDEIIRDYVMLWLNEKGDSYAYSTWLLHAVYEYCCMRDDFSFGIENLDKMIHFYEQWERGHMTEEGLFWSIDAQDAMEFSISGTTPEYVGQPGLRPTLNSYMAANAQAIARIAEKAGRTDIARLYAEKSEHICKKMINLLWDGEFFRAVHSADKEHFPKMEELSEEKRVRELIGYIPWCFSLVPQGFERAFLHLKEKDGFQSRFGLTTAERRHPRFLYHAAHECLWNGYIWPFATTQTINAVINLLNEYEQDILTDADFYDMLLTYAQCHYRKKEAGDTVCWIDEVLHPDTGEWSSRTILKNMSWQEEKGGYERGKDYNHSGFADLVIRGLLGVGTEGGKVTVCPRIPEAWSYFMLDNVWIGGKCFRVIYDKDGHRYKNGIGLKLEEKRRGSL